MFYSWQNYWNSIVICCMCNKIYSTIGKLHSLSKYWILVHWTFHIFSDLNVFFLYKINFLHNLFLVWIFVSPQITNNVQIIYCGIIQWRFEHEILNNDSNNITFATIPRMSTFPLFYFSDTQWHCHYSAIDWDVSSHIITVCWEQHGMYHQMIDMPPLCDWVFLSIRLWIHIFESNFK